MEFSRKLGTRRWLSSGLLRRVVWSKFTDVSEVLAAFIMWAILMTQKTAIFILAALRTRNLTASMLVPGRNSVIMACLRLVYVMFAIYMLHRAAICVLFAICS
jgi:hypothetical protein